jgi:hypothetical protein
MYLCASGIDVTSFYDFSIRYEMFLQYGIVGPHVITLQEGYQILIIFKLVLYCIIINYIDERLN